MYQKLSTKEGERDVYRIGKLRERRTRDFNQVKCIKEDNNRILVKNDEIKNKWRDYFEKLFNEEGDSTMIKIDYFLMTTVGILFVEFKNLR